MNRRNPNRPTKTDPGRAALLALYDANPRAFAVRLLYLCLQADDQTGLADYYGVAAETLRAYPRPGADFLLALERKAVYGPRRARVPLLIEAFNLAKGSREDPNQGTLAVTLGWTYFWWAYGMPEDDYRWKSIVKESAHWYGIASDWFKKHPQVDTNDMDIEAREHGAAARGALQTNSPAEAKAIIMGVFK